MTDDPQSILKSAKTSLVALREALKVKDPWDKEIEFCRRDARRHYLHLIFEFPYSPQALAMDNPMWMETSHACIAVYRSRIATLDKAIAARTGHAPTRPSGPTPVVEHRKLVQRFRQFLAEEEKFWTAFILRFARQFALQEAQPHLDTLQLTRPANGQHHTGNNHHDDDPSSGRNSTFPPDSKPLAPPPAQREKKVAMLVKAIISLGDLARYKEQYNERQGRPKAGAEDVPPRWATKGSRKSGESVPRPRNYARAHACYTQARLLLPDAGQASHQLAILASYQADTFGAILHYYRSICVKFPFAVAQENLYKTIAKTYEAYAAEPGGLAKDDEAARAVVDRFKKDIVILHCMWRLDKATDAELFSHTQYTLSRFSTLLADRLLPINFVVKVYTAALGALWTFRIARKSESSKNSNNGPSKGHNAANKEATVLKHVMDLHLALLKLATAQLDPATLPTTGTAPNGTTLPTPAPAEKITVVLRRILQSLRVASRWVTANADYLSRSTKPDKAPPALMRTMGDFWSSYAEFSTALNAAFGGDPAETAALGHVVLEEDVELEGFTPLKGSLKGHHADRGDKSGATLLNQVHPNDEYLLRIREILEDAEGLVKSESTPLRLQNGIYVSSTEVFTPISEQPPYEHGLLTPSRTTNIGNGHFEKPIPIEELSLGKPGEPMEDDVASVSTEDPVTLAMRATLGNSDDDFDDGMEEEQILFPQGTWSGLHSSPIQPNGLHPIMPLRDPHAFHLADLNRFEPQIQHHAQLHSPQHDIFGPSSGTFTAPYSPPGLGSQPIGSMHYYHDLPASHQTGMQGLGNMIPSNSPRANQSMFSMGANQPLYTSPYRPSGPLPLANGMQTLSTSQIPITPRQRRNDRLSIGAGTPLAPYEISPTTPPKTAQDLLLRVLGAAPNASASGHTNGGQAPNGNPHLSASPPRLNSSGSSPDANRPAPLLFGGSAGNSIWAP